MQTVGDYLKNERETKKLSVLEVSKITKISGYYITCLEKGDYDKLPKGPYIKGFITSYARLVGGDEDQALKLYNSQKDGHRQPKTIQPKAKRSTKLSRKVFSVSLKEKTGAFINRLTSILKIQVAFLAKAKLNGKIKWRRGRSRMWISAGMVLLAVGIVMFAGFGFYHLFIFEKNSPLPGNLPEKKINLDRKKSAQKNVSPVEKMSPERSHSKSAKSSSKPPERHTHPFQQALKEANPRSLTANADTQSGQTFSPLPFVETPAADPSQVEAALTLLKASVCTKIKDHMPNGSGNRFPWSTNRIYVWSMVAAKHPPSKVRHIYYFKNEKVSNVVLDVHSDRWRTWSYKSIADESYKGPWRVDIATMDGQVLRRLYFNID
jgi:cytoskeletal protein RodZ